MAEPLLGQIMLFAGNYAPEGWALCNGALMAINQNQALYSIIGVTYGGNGSTTFALPDLRGRVPIGMGQYTENGTTTNYISGQKYGAASQAIAINNIPAHTHGVDLSKATTSVPATGLSVATTVSDVTITATASYGVPATTDTSSPSSTPGTDYVLGISKTSSGSGLNTYYKPTDSTKNVSLKQSNITVTGSSKVTATSTLTGTATGTIGGTMTATQTGGGQPFDNRQPSIVMNYIIAITGMYPVRS